MDKYIDASKITRRVLSDVLEKIQVGQDIQELCVWGTTLLEEACACVYKKEPNKGVAMPLTISVDNLVGYCIPDNMNIPEHGVVKVELGVNIGGCIVVAGKTVLVGDAIEQYKHIVSLLDKIQFMVSNVVKHNETTAEVKMAIESLCTDCECFPLENTISYQHVDGHPKTSESKYMVLNHTKYYDEENVAVEPNTCFAFEQGEVYTINIVVVPNTEEGYTIKEHHVPHVARLNDYYFNLKLQSSKQFYSKVKQRYGHNAFYLKQYQSPKDKLGLKECIESGIMDVYPVQYLSPNIPVFHNKFTILVKESKSIVL